MVGSALSRSLIDDGHEVWSLSRAPSDHKRRVLHWNWSSGEIELPPEGADVVVHLAGENIASGRWTEAKKQRIRASRVEGTKLLVNALLEKGKLPKKFISASAVGGYSGAENESLVGWEPSSEDFLGTVVVDWEAAAIPLKEKAVSVSFARFGIVLSKDGGALAKMLPVFRAGLGGRLGNGQQMMSWISLRDGVRALRCLIDHESAAGPYNMVSPHPCSNAEFTKALGKAVGRPAFFRVPAFILRMFLGEMAEEVLLSSSKAKPGYILLSGFQFKDTEIGETLARIINETES